MNKLTYIFAKCNQGQSKKGVEKAYKYAHNILKKSALNIENEKFNSRLGYLDLRNNVIQEIKQNKTPFIFGGDHSISIGSLSGSLNCYKDDLTTIWVDAHADINTKKESLSGNLHGMPLAYLTGLESNIFHNIKNHKLKFENLIYLGLRDVDDFEKKVIKENNIKNLTSNELNNNIPLDSIEINTENIHLSIDVDVLDPKIMPCTGTPVKRGISLEKLEEIIWWAKIMGNLVCIDLVEFNPKIGLEDEFNKSLKNYKQIIDLIHKIYYFDKQKN